VLVVESSQNLIQPAGPAAELTSAISASSAGAEKALGEYNPFQLVAAPGDNAVPVQSQQDIQNAIRSLLPDARSASHPKPPCPLASSSGMQPSPK
jgi:hypothetical protein